MKQIERLRSLANCDSLSGPEIDEMWRALPALLSHIDALEARVAEAETIAGIAAIPDVAGMAERAEAAERALAEAVEVLTELLTATQPQHSLKHVFLGEAQENARAFIAKMGEK